MQSNLRWGGLLVTLPIAILLWNVPGRSGTVPSAAKDGPPVVQITTPRNNSVHPWNTLVNYSIVVTDHGKSTKYQEIPSKLVLLKTAYVPDLSKFSAGPAEAEKADPPGLRDILRSNCLGCHGFKSTAMGPSFSAISERYPHTKAAVEDLSQKIQKGSVGVWGREAMPPHTDLTEEELHDISTWVLNKAAEPGVNYYAGTEGAFQMGAPAKPGANAGLALTASYVGGAAQQNAAEISRWEKTIVIRGQ